MQNNRQRKKISLGPGKNGRLLKLFYLNLNMHFMEPLVLAASVSSSSKLDKMSGLHVHVFACLRLCSRDTSSTWNAHTNPWPWTSKSLLQWRRTSHLLGRSRALLLNLKRKSAPTFVLDSQFECKNSQSGEQRIHAVITSISLAVSWHFSPPDSGGCSSLPTNHQQIRRNK